MHTQSLPSGLSRQRKLSLLSALLLLAVSLAFGPASPRPAIPGFRASAAISPAAAAQAEGTYTEAQARRGQEVYDRRCASCHGPQLEGAAAAALAGERFMAKWGQGNHNVDELYFINRTQMPFEAAGTLTTQQYIDVTAYMLKVNGYKPGTRELPADSAVLQRIKIEPQGSFRKLPTENQPGGAAKAAAGGASPTSSKRPSQEELNAAQTNTTDWLHSNHDYAGQRFVDLKQITPQNVASLRPACLYQTGDTKAFHNNPLVYRGVMYITTSRSTIALEATSCQVRWRHDWRPKSLEVWPPNRGVAIKDGRVVRATTDGYLFALDLETGKLIWEKKVIASEKNEGSFNIAPVIFEDLILLGLGISEQGVKGWIGAFKLENGDPVWRFNTVPDDGEPGAETWGKPEAKLHGGGAVWSPLALDPQAGLVYVPVANPAPDFYGDVRPGVNLYTCSLVVLNARTGKLQWYYQAVPHDTHDWDLTQVSPLFTTTVGGKTRKLVAVSGKDGRLQVLDRETKEHLYEVPVTTRLNAEVPVTTQGVHACPGVLGGVQWNGPAFNPRTNMLYVPAVDWCGTYKKAEEARFIPGQQYMGGSYVFDPPEKARGWLTAIDASTGQIAWRYQSSRPMLAAVTTTAADLVFTGELTGDLIALDARTGKVLYRFHTSAPLNGGLVSYAINGKQYVAVAAGSASGFWGTPPSASTIIIFALP
jgi:alcohol dehydrogenase (cytochrome c)